MTQRRFNPFWALYTYLVFLPVAAAWTMVTAIVAIVSISVGLYGQWLERFIRFWARFICVVALCPVKIEGIENIDPDKQYIFLANHQGLLDIFVIYGFLPNRFAWIMKKELRMIPLVGFACKKVGHIFIDRSSPVKSMQSLQQAEKVLSERGASIVMFPEGTRTRTGEVGRFKGGAFKIASDLNFELAPLTIRGSFEVMPKGSYWIKPNVVSVKYHKPLLYEEGPDFVSKVRDIIIDN